MTTRIRVLIVEDSSTVRRHLYDTIDADPELEVIGEAADGKQAIDLCRQLRPDVITLDMALPLMSGLAVTEYVMAYCPTPILIVSSSVNRGELFKTYEALCAGATDILEKPNGQDSDQDWSQRFLSTLKIVSRVRVISHPRLRLSSLGRQAGAGRLAPQPRHDGRDRSVIVIGASTGGPGAILEILQGLGAGFNVPILLVLHIGKAFASALPEWIEANCAFRVRYAVDGESMPTPGEPLVILAPPDVHLELRDRRLRLSDAPERHSCRPSVDVLFESIAREMRAEVVACLLTGMGRDGARGLLAIREAGGLTLAQDEASCVVFGMPREAISLGAAERVLPLADIAGNLLKAVNA
jgi:two-component system chemotaxis response regulator CheB